MLSPDRPQRFPLIPLLVFLLVAIGLSIAGWVYLDRQKEALAERVGGELATIAELKVRQLAVWRDGQLADARAILQNPMIASQVREYLIDGRPEREKDLMAWLGALQKNYDYHSALLLDLQSRIRLAVGQAEPSLGEHARALARQAAQSRSVLLSDFHCVREVELIHLDLLVPVLDPRGGPEAPCIGVLLFRIDPQRFLYPLVRSWPAISRTAETLLVRREGNDVVFLNDLRHWTNAALQLRRPASTPGLPAAMAVRGREGFVEGNDYRGQPVLAVLQRVPDSPWFLIAKVDAAEVFGQLHLSARLIGLFDGTMLLIASLILLSWWQQQKAVYYRRQYEAERERDALARHYDYLTRYANDAILLMDDQWRIIEANERVAQLYGYTREELLRLRGSDLRTPEEQARFAEHMRQVSQQAGLVFETMHRRKDGTTFPVEVSSRRIQARGTAYYQSIIRDVTERRRAEQRILRLNRIYAVLSQINQAIVRLRDRQELFREICRIGVEYGRFRLAWVGWVEDGSSEVRPVAHSGVEDGYLGRVRITMQPDQPEGAGPTGTALRDGHCVICNDIAADPRMAPWREEALRRGYRASAAIPLRFQGRVAGTFNVYAADPGFFDAEDVGLLDEVGMDISFALDAMEEEVRRRRVEEALKQSEAKFTRAFQGSPMLMAISTLEDGRLLEVNESFLRALGYRRDEVIGRTSGELQLFVDPEQRRQILERVLEEGAARDMDVLIRTRDGSLRHGAFSAEVIELEGGRHLLTVMNDVTERKQAEAEIRRLAMVVEQAAEAVIITDTRGAIQYVNPAFERITGYAAAEVLGQNPRLLKSGRQSDDFYGSMWAALTRGQVWRGRFTNRRRDGTLYEVDAALSPIRDAAGQTVSYVSIARDITREVQLEQQFREAQKMEAIGRLAGGIAHDFNNLLTSILGFARFVRDALGEGHPTTADVDEIIHSADRAANLTKQLLTFSRRQVLQVEAVDLNAVVTDMDKLLRRTLGEHIELVTLIDSEAGCIEADVGLLEQAIMNLAVNARDAMPKGGKLTLQTAAVRLSEDFARRRADAQPGEYVRLSVGDTGMGMTAEVREHCFEPFFTTKEKGKGTGLGLALVYNIVTQFTGFIEIESEPGAGTRMHLYFPRTAPLPAPEGGGAEAVQAPRGTETVLVVEDEETVRRLTVKLLASLGYDVLEARHGGEALLLFMQHPAPVELVLTDVIMPQMGGPDMILRMRKIRPGFRVLFMSGFTDGSFLETSDPGAPAAILLKPFTREALAQKVREVLDGPPPAA